MGLFKHKKESSEEEPKEQKEKILPDPSIEKMDRQEAME